MIVNKNLLEEVKKFGLNTYEAKIWTALLSRGISTAGELAEIANVPRSRSYDVLESLDKKGFIIPKLGKPIQYLAIKPDQVVERVQKKLNEEADYKIKQLNKLKNSEVLNELNTLHVQGVETLDPMEITSLIRGRDNILNHLGCMIKNAKNSVHIATSDTAITLKMSELQRQFNKAKKNGVKISFSIPQKNISENTLKQMQSYGEVKKGSNDKRFAIADGQEVLLMLAHDTKINSQYDTAIWAKSEFLAKSLK